MLPSEFQASEPSNYEEEDFWIHFYAFLWFEPRSPWRLTILDSGSFIWTNLVKDQYAMLQTKF